MKLLPFVLKHLRRNRIRTGSTVAAMAICVLFFCTLESVLARFNRIVESRSPRRLVTRHAVSIFNLLPLPYADEIRKLPGVSRVAIASAFGGLLATPKEGRSASGASEWISAFQNVAVDAEPYFAMNPELSVAPAEFRDFLADLRGCVIGRDLARGFGWKLGDRFFLESFASGYRKATGPFEFVIRGFIDADPRYPETETNLMVFHFRYLSEGLGGRIPAGMFMVEVDDPASAAETAAAIDAIFENSSEQTLTESEREFTAEFMSMVGDLGVLVRGIGLAVCFTILLVTANTMSMAVRERRTEIAVLKAVGFTSGRVMALVVCEALLLGALGGGLGVAGAQGLLQLLNNSERRNWFGLSSFELSPLVAAAGLAVALLLGLAAGLMPALAAYRARVADVLRSE